MIWVVVKVTHGKNNRTNTYEGCEMASYKPPKELGIYNTGIKEATKLEAEYDAKANTIQKAYEAAVQDMGYSDREMQDPTKARKVAKAMFSDKYLGNTEFNPHLSKGHAELGDMEKSLDMKERLGMNLQDFVGRAGLIARYGSLQRTTVAQAVSRHLDDKVAEGTAEWIWDKAYDPDASLADNMKNYAELLKQDPILSGTGAKLDPGKFDSVDDMANALATSLRGNSSRQGFQYGHGVDFN